MAFGHPGRCPQTGGACLELSWALTLTGGRGAGNRGQRLPPRLGWHQEDQAEVSIKCPPPGLSLFRWGRPLPPCRTGRPRGSGAPPCTTHPPLSDAFSPRLWEGKVRPCRRQTHVLVFKASGPTNAYHRAPYPGTSPGSRKWPSHLAWHSPLPTLHHRDLQAGRAWIQTPEPSFGAETVAASSQAAWENVGAPVLPPG